MERMEKLRKTLIRLGRDDDVHIPTKSLKRSQKARLDLINLVYN